MVCARRPLACILQDLLQIEMLHNRSHGCVCVPVTTAPGMTIKCCCCRVCVQVVATKPTEMLLPELLVGFNPIPHYITLLEERFSHLATFCSDSVGGFSAVGVKWHPEAFLPSQLQPATAHSMMELGLTVSAPGSSHVSMVVPNACQISHELRQLGLGLVQEVLLV